VKASDPGILFFSIRIRFSNAAREGYSDLSKTWSARGIEITVINNFGCTIEVHLWRSQIGFSHSSFSSLSEADRASILNDLYSNKYIERFSIKLFETTEVPGRICQVYSFVTESEIE
jgi:hypothetical protein